MTNSAFKRQFVGLKQTDKLQPTTRTRPLLERANNRQLVDSINNHQKPFHLSSGDTHHNTQIDGYL